MIHRPQWNSGINIIISMQPSYFLQLTHSMSRRAGLKPFGISAFRTLFITTGVHPPVSAQNE